MGNIVVVDDHPDLLELLEYNLTVSGFKVNAFSKSLDALDFINSNATDMIITDWMMPEMDGIEFCKTIKTTPETSRLPVIMLTCKNTERDRYIARQNGADDFLSKPFRVRELVVRINKLIQVRNQSA